LYVFSVEDAAGNGRARERVDGLKKNQGASETRHTGVSALRASRIHQTADHWLTPAAIASRLCEPVRTNAKHKSAIIVMPGFVKVNYKPLPAESASNKSFSMQRTLVQQIRIQCSTEIMTMPISSNPTDGRRRIVQIQPLMQPPWKAGLEVSTDSRGRDSLCIATDSWEQHLMPSFSLPVNLLWIAGQVWC
jgi:hypothetical protein